ncbi:ricin-type beta-trefoil lectin domain protein [Streptomyces sp. NPDC086787]|uniref:ricin-type beta-trefoil lectin domain protein n=1 Tax=Streptomyces sp. NPDC086787 TaxID=3365759 RepID=UPI0037F65406
MFRHSHRRRLRALAGSAVGAALMVTLLPAQAIAVPPPTTRDGVPLEDLQQDLPVSGESLTASRSGFVYRAPTASEEPPEDTVVPPQSGTYPVNFGGTPVTPARYSGGDGARAAEAVTAATATDEPAEPKQAGPLPVSIGQAPDSPAPTGTWQVGLKDRATTEGLDIDGALITVTTPPGGELPVQVELKYDAFRNLYGADWASRLELVQFPECYLTTPDVEECSTYTELDTVNDTATGTVSATVDPAADGTTAQSASATRHATSGSGVMQASYRATPTAAGSGTAVVGAVDSGSGESGSFKATPLSAAGKWAAGNSSGGFSWSYPMPVPPSPAGPAPDVSLSYSSQAVDGRTATNAPQTSWIGEGWDYEPGHIERRYRSCKDDTKEDAEHRAPNNTAKKDKTSDLCWVSYNAVMSLGGSSGELVRVGNTNMYKPEHDDGTRVELRTGGDNGDDNGEYWVVTTTDGTQYYYGLNKVGGGHADTNSVFTVPVFGNHPDEPCHGATFAASRCTDSSGKKLQQAWHWGLDKVVDVHGNAMIVNWKRETNHYAVNKKTKSPESYVRGGYPVSIEYGLRPSSLTSPAAKVVFETAERCLESETVCDPDNFEKTKDPKSYQKWWDSPGNLNCKSTSKRCPAFPSFWIRTRLDAVTTYAARSGQTELGKVDSWELDQRFPRDWYDTSPGLWLSAISHRAFAPGDSTGVKEPSPTTFAPYTVDADDPLGDYLKDKQLPNLVRRSSTDKRPGFTRPRIGTITTDAGADIDITYRGGCKTEPDVAPKDNHNTCFPVHWSPDGELTTPPIAWFNKYVVDSVREYDKMTTNGAEINTHYTYEDPAWSKDGDEFSKPELRTYSVWSGYGKVISRKGSAAGDGTQTQTETHWFRGTGETIKDSRGMYTLGVDKPEYAGMIAESIKYDKAGGKVVGRTLNFPWSSAATASRARDGDLAPLTAQRSGVRREDDIAELDSGWRATRTVTDFDDTYGLPSQVETAVVNPDGSGGEKLGEQSCTVSQYLNNTTANLIGLPKLVRKTGTSCADYADADPATELISAERTTYDTLSYGDTPTRGLPTTVESNDAAGTGWIRTAVKTYDPLGRLRTVKDAADQIASTEYTPGDIGGPVTATKVTDKLGLSTLTTLDPGRGSELTVTDANGKVTRSEYDAFGRFVKGWGPSHSSGTQDPDVRISYQLAAKNRLTAVTTESLRDDGSYSKHVVLYDGFLRQIQTQAPAHGPGRVITDTFYNDHGLASRERSAYLVKGDPSTDQFKAKSDTLYPSELLKFYDGQERPVKTTTVHSGVEKWSDKVEYGPDWVRTDPAGDAKETVTVFADALGRTSHIDHATDTAGKKSRSTTYHYDVRGKRDRVTDEAGNTWTSAYDSRGRLTRSVDPDAGTVKQYYDDLDRVVQTVDARGVTQYTDYDAGNRVTAVREGSPTAAPVKEWTFDKLPGAKGKLSESVRHDPTGDFVNRVTGYDSEYHITGAETVIPDTTATKGLAGTYKYRYDYTRTGKPLSVTMPATPGGLAEERVITRYDKEGKPESTSGLTWYTADVSYSPFGEVLRTVNGPQPYRVWTTNFIDEHTGRVQRSVSDRETAGPYRVADTRYAYDLGGNITSLATQSATATATSWDTQCFTYDVMGEMVHAWTSSITPNGSGTGCRSASGSTWGYRGDAQPSTGPVAEAPDAVSDATAPDSQLTASLANAAPDTATLASGGTAYWDAYTFDVVGNRAGLTQHDGGAAVTATRAYRYGTNDPAAPQPHTLTASVLTLPGKTPVTEAYGYDASGNTTTRPGGAQPQSLVWTADNHLDSTSDGTGTSDHITGLGGVCLDVAGGNSADGTVIQIYTCNTSAAQQWTFDKGQLKAVGKCAAASGTTERSPVKLATCNTADPAQQWTLGADGSLRNTAAQRCLDIPGANTAPSTDLQVYTCNGTSAQRWTVGGNTDYVYDAEGNRLLERTRTGSTLFLGETQITTDATGKAVRATRAYSNDAAPTVVRTTSGSATGHKLSVLLGDQHGSSDIAVELGAGQTVTRRAFKPFGELRGAKPGAWPDRRGFVGGVDDASTGLTHLGAREYDSALGRFISADPVFDIGDPLQMNGYAYARNNPVNRSDPSGLYDPDLMAWCQQNPGKCIGGHIIIEKKKAHTQVTKNKGTSNEHHIFYDEHGIPHATTNDWDAPSSRAAYKQLNGDLKKGGKFYDEKTRTGARYFYQDETYFKFGKDNKLAKGYLDDPANKQHVKLGTTADLIKVTWEKGKVVSVEIWDAVEATSSDKALKDITGDIDGKMGTKKHQTDNVVFVAADDKQAKMVAEHYKNDGRVRVISPNGGFDNQSSAVSLVPAHGSTDARGGSRGPKGPKVRAVGLLGPVFGGLSAAINIRDYGFKRGAWETFKDSFDPFDFTGLDEQDAIDDANEAGICDPNVNCA